MRDRIPFSLSLFSACLLFQALLPETVKAENGLIEADIDQRRVAVTTGYDGADLLIFGVVNGPGEILVLVEGPERTVQVHRRNRVMGLWLGRTTATFGRVPGFYWTATSAPLDPWPVPLRLLPPSDRALSEQDLLRHHEAILDRLQEQGLHQIQEGAVTRLSDDVFRADLRLPPNAPTGTYRVHVHLVREGEVVDSRTFPLQVDKAGLTVVLSALGHEKPLLYALMILALAVLSGLVIDRFLLRR